MSRFLVSKEEFVTAIEEIKKVDDYQDGLNGYFRKNNVDGYIFQPDCIPTTLRLLHLIFGDADKEEWIDYFCNELGYGKKWKPGTAKGNNGEDIKLETPEDLYDFLCSQ